MFKLLISHFWINCFSFTFLSKVFEHNFYLRPRLFLQWLNLRYFIRTVCNAEITRSIITWLTYATYYSYICSIYPNLKVLYVLQNRRLLDCWCTKRLSTNHAFLTNGVRVEKNLKVLWVRATESLGNRARRKIPSPINKNFGKSYWAK